ncbi:hypothetical protein T01_4789 [Trichinella spiralis]|uniref:Uncharacterized protein n=1 Tax=Trichinella spiralis TaxID=6334 RepID=A0A0V0ZPP3_TRISP|nr:hypothetical protein T01_4789 [Trichinella spiralis]
MEIIDIHVQKLTDPAGNSEMNLTGGGHQLKIRLKHKL